MESKYSLPLVIVPVIIIINLLLLLPQVDSMAFFFVVNPIWGNHHGLL